MRSALGRLVHQERYGRATSPLRWATAKRLPDPRSASASAGGTARRRSTDWWRGWRIWPVERFIRCRTCSRRLDAKVSVDEFIAEHEGRGRRQEPSADADLSGLSGDDADRSARG